MIRCDEKIWDYMLVNLFSEKTNLFYDYIVPEKRGEFEKYLPTPDYINKQIPNPCGWGTGMEDSMINGSVMLDAAVLGYELTNDESFKVLAKKFFKGLKHCATISESKGFLARSVSPVDGKSHYIDSSRDQYTHWVCASAKYHDSVLSDADEKKAIEEILLSFANRARENVTTEKRLEYAQGRWWYRLCYGVMECGTSRNDAPSDALSCGVENFGG